MVCTDLMDASDASELGIGGISSWNLHRAWVQMNQDAAVCVRITNTQNETVVYDVSRV